MKVILSITIMRTNGGLHAILHKEIETEIVPIPGAGVEDSAWNEPRVPTRIECNFTEGHYFLDFGTVLRDTEKECIQEANMYEDHYWRKPGADLP